MADRSDMRDTSALIPVDLGRPFEKLRLLRDMLDHLPHRVATDISRFHPDDPVTSYVPILSLSIPWLRPPNKRTPSSH